MKIGMLADMYKPYVSGVTSYISLYKRFLEDAGHEVYVFTFGLGIHDAETNIIRSPGVPLPVKGVFTHFRYCSRAQELLAKMDVAHIHHPMVSAKLAFRYCLPRGIPLVFTNHTRYDIYGRVYFPNTLGRRYNRFLRNYLPGVYEKMDVVIVPSEKIKPILAPFGLPQSARVIPHGVDLRLFRSRSPSQVRSELSIEDESLVLIYVGRLGKEKNLPALLEIYSNVLRKYDNVQLVIVGEGPEQKRLERQSKELGIYHKIRFTGERPYNALPAYYQAADIFLMPSLNETFGFTVVEAMASGLPVVAYDVPGINDTVEDNVTGLLAAPGLEDFSAKTSQLIASPDLRLRLSRGALHAAEKYSIEVSTAELVSVYQELVRH